MAWPSKSGIVSAILGIPATSDGDTGIIPLASIGTLAFVGQRLRVVNYNHCNVCGPLSPVDVGTAWIESKVKPAFTVGEDTNVHWNQLD